MVSDERPNLSNQHRTVLLVEAEHVLGATQREVARYQAGQRKGQTRTPPGRLPAKPALFHRQFPGASLQAVARDDDQRRSVAAAQHHRGRARLVDVHDVIGPPGFGGGRRPGPNGHRKRDAAAELPARGPWHVVRAQVVHLVARGFDPVVDEPHDAAHAAGPRPGYLMSDQNPHPLRHSLTAFCWSSRAFWPMSSCPRGWTRSSVSVRLELSPA